jgi:hypothetical protein
MRPHTQPSPAPSTSGRAPTAACACSTPGRRGVAVAVSLREDERMRVWGAVPHAPTPRTLALNLGRAHTRFATRSDPPRRSLNLGRSPLLLMNSHTAPFLSPLSLSLSRSYPQALPATLVTTVQDAIVGGAVFAAIGAAAWAGTKGDPEPCSLCAGTGGCGCFACGSSGATAVPKPAADALPAARPPKRDILGRVPPPAGQCRVCGGTGLVFCSSCRGSGYRKLL